ncbi:MAG: hypothetical protein Q9161_003161 [Pseudevernia consocians]
MVLLKRCTPSTLSAYVTAPSLPAATIDRVLADFRRGAYDAYDPGVRLVLDRRRFVNASPQEVRAALDGEGRDGEAFLIVDEGTTYLAILASLISIHDSLPHPYDPVTSQTEPPIAIYDWTTNPPPPPLPIHVVASPEEFETSTSPQDTERFVIPPDGHPREVVRLKEGVAREVGLRSEWAVGGSVAREEGVAEGSLVFEQGWDC